MSKHPTAVFVHGFLSSASIWKALSTFARADQELASRGFSFDTGFEYPTHVAQLSALKRIPSVKDCGKYLADHLASVDSDEIFLIGHSMGGLVIQSCLAGLIATQRGGELRRIRSVILLATPNRGSTLLQTTRSIVERIISNPQNSDLEVLNEDMADVSDTIVRCLLDADAVTAGTCPIPFRVFWGLEDDVVREVSAKGPFAEASPLPGGHSEIIQPQSSDDKRFLALKDALLNPVGHPCIYEIDNFDVRLTLSPLPGTPITLDGDVRRREVPASDKAVRELSIEISPRNRCTRPYEQPYRSDDGYVQLLALTEPNLASDTQKSAYYETSKTFSYVFQPPRSAATYKFALAIYNGFGEGQRGWHNHMDPKANYGRIRFTLDLEPYRTAGFHLTTQPAFYYYEQDTMDHTLCRYRSLGTPVAPIAGEQGSPWRTVWELANVRGGVIDVVWDYAKND